MTSWPPMSSTGSPRKRPRSTNRSYSSRFHRLRAGEDSVTPDTLTGPGEVSNVVPGGGTLANAPDAFQTAAFRICSGIRPLLRVSESPKYLLALATGHVLGSRPDRVRPLLGSRRSAMASVVALGPEAAVTLQVLDRRQAAWYCVDCLADAVGLDGVAERSLHRLTV